MTSLSASPQAALTPATPLRVALIEDDDTQRDEINQLLLADTAMAVIGTWESAESAAASLPGLRPDVVLVDIGLPGQSGIELVQRLQSQLPGTQFMMLTVCDDTERIFRALAAGATGYLLKKDAPAHLLAAIQDLHAGGSPMSSAIARKVVTRFQPPARSPARTAAPAPPLSPREQEILELLAQGRLYKDIAEHLGIAYGTVRTHIRRIYEKLQAHNRTQAVRLGGVA